MGKKILMICYYYPPLIDVGCKRSVAFSKYWKKAGWEPHILSVKNPDTTYCSLGDDKPPEGVQVTYTYSLFNIYKFLGRVNGLLSRILGLVGVNLKSNYFYDIFCIPDIFIGWILPAIFAGRKIIKKEKIDIIYVSCSPFSAGIIGWWLKKITGIPLCLDFRDPFGVDCSRYNRYFKELSFRKSVNRRFVATMLRNCDLFTVTTDETKGLYVEQFDEIIKNKIHTIHNGFDHQFLSGIQRCKKYSKFTVVYAGNFYYDIEFDYFFEGLGILKKERKINKDNFQFLLYGGQIGSIKESVEQWGVNDLVHVKPRIPYADALVEIKKAHMQFLRIMQPMISTKLFEGIALDIPLLATVPAGEVVRIIREYSPSSSIVTDESASSVAYHIEKAMNLREEDLLPNRVEDFLSSFSREKLSLHMVELFSQHLDKQVTA